MKNSIYCLICIIILIGCAGSPLRTGVEAEKNVIALSDIRKGMSERQVRQYLGRPSKIETEVADGQTYTVWLYITKEVDLDQTKLIHENFTPLIFQNGTLIGWGYPFYKNLFNIDRERQKKQEEIRQKYTDDAEEWPPADTNKIISPTPSAVEQQAPETNKVEQAVKPEALPAEVEKVVEDDKKEIEEKPVQPTDPCKDMDRSHPNHNLWD